MLVRSGTHLRLPTCLSQRMQTLQSGPKAASLDPLPPSRNAMPLMKHHTAPCNTMQAHAIHAPPCNSMLTVIRAWQMQGRRPLVRLPGSCHSGRCKGGSRGKQRHRQYERQTRMTCCTQRSALTSSENDTERAASLRQSLDRSSDFEPRRLQDASQSDGGWLRWRVREGG